MNEHTNLTKYACAFRSAKFRHSLPIKLEDFTPTHQSNGRHAIPITSSSEEAASTQSSYIFQCNTPNTHQHKKNKSTWLSCLQQDRFPPSGTLLCHCLSWQFSSSKLIWFSLYYVGDYQERMLSTAHCCEWCTRDLHGGERRIPARLGCQQYNISARIHLSGFPHTLPTRVHIL